MKIYGYMGTNKANVSGVSWKMWKIQQTGRKVTTWWGPAIVSKRRLVPQYELNFKTRTFKNEEAARKFADERIADKISTGYERFKSHS